MAKQTISIVLFFYYYLFSTVGNTQQLTFDSLSIKAKIDSAFLLKETDYKQAMKLYNKAFKEALTYGSDTDINHALYIGGVLNWLNGKHTKAIDNSRQSLVLSTKLNDTLHIAKNYTLLGLVYLYKSDFDSAIVNFDRSLSYYIALNDTTQILKNYGFKGIVYDKQADFVNAKENILKTVYLKRKFNTQNWSILDITQNPSINLTYYQESLINAKKNLAGFGENPNPSANLRFSFHRIGVAYLKLNQPDSALLFFKKSGETAKKMHLNVYWDEQARAYRQLGLYDSAILCNKQTITDAKRSGTNITLANSYMQLGYSYEGQESYTEASNVFFKALELNKQMEHKNTIMNVFRFISDVAIKTNQLHKGLLYADSSFLMAQKIGAKQGKIKAMLNQYTVYKLQGNYKKAFNRKQSYDSLKDNLKSEAVQLNLAQLDLYNEVELNKLEIRDLNKQQALSKANLKNKTLVIVIISIIVLFVVLLLLFNFFRTKKLRRLNNELNKQQNVISTQNQQLSKSNKEKEILLGEIHHRVKNNLQTITSLLSIQKRKLKDPESIKVLEDSQNRVTAMGLIHQHLYQNASFAEIDFKNYTKELVRVLISTNAGCAIDVKCIIPALKIELDNAIFFGLIINELAINSIKHAYNGVEHPLLELSIFEIDNKIVLLVKDNGNEKDIDFNKLDSFGWKMVNNICDKLNGELSVDNTNGLAVQILFTTDIISIA